MSLRVVLKSAKCPLRDDEERHIRRHLERLGLRLAHFPEPIATLVLERHPRQRRIEAALRVELGPLGDHLISHQAAETAGHAVRLASEDVERQLERRLAKQRGEHT